MAHKNASRVTDLDKQEIWEAAQAAAIALAGFWDVLRQIEQLRSCEITYNTALETIAGDCGIPAQFSDFKGMTADDFAELLTITA